ncbi:MAG: hypothetical protein VX583_14430 [Bdellovibrionota bacterium]
MDIQKVFISTSFGLLRQMGHKELEGQMDYYDQLQEQSGLEIHFCLGKNAERILRLLPRLQNFPTHFSLQETNLVGHISDAAGKNLEASWLWSFHVSPPISYWEDWKNQLETLENLKNQADIFSFCPYFPSALPIFLSERGLKKLYDKIRKRESIKIQDFDWRFAENMAQIRLSNNELENSENEFISPSTMR